MGGDLCTGKGIAGVKAHAEARRRAVGLENAEIGGEIVGGIFRSNPALQGISPHLDGSLVGNIDFRVGQGLAFGHQDLGLHQVAAGDHFSDGVFHLDARVHLDEIEVSLLVQQELHRSCIPVPHMAGNFQGCAA